MGRLIDTDIWSDDFFTEQDITTRLIWIGLITGCADDQGRFIDNIQWIHTKIFPMDNIDNSIIGKSIEAIEKYGRIRRYEADGKNLIQIVHWWEYQKSRWAGRSKYSPPIGWVDRIRYHGQGGKEIKENWESKGGFEEANTTPYIDTYTTPDVNDDVKDDDDVKGDEEEKFSHNNAKNLYTENHLNLWNQVIGEMHRYTTKAIYDSWISPLELHHVEGGCFYIKAKNSYTIQILSERTCIQSMNNILRSMPGCENFKIEIFVPELEIINAD
jgi:hypothetical protein